MKGRVDFHQPTIIEKTSKIIILISIGSNYREADALQYYLDEHAFLFNKKLYYRFIQQTFVTFPMPLNVLSKYIIQLV